MNADAPLPLTGLEAIFSNVVSTAIAVGGIALFIMIVIAGYKYISAGEDAKSAQGAKQTLTYAIYGIILLALSYLFLRIISSFTGVTGILNFQIQGPAAP